MIHWPSLLVLVRHAEAENNVMSGEEKRHFPFSTHQCKLTSRGKKQAEILRNYLKKRFPKGFDAYYTSYYLRSWQTFKTVYPLIQPIEDSRLAELRRGVGEIISKKTLEKLNLREQMRKKIEGKFHHKPLNGESMAELETRLRDMATWMRIEHPKEEVIMFNHGKTILDFMKIFQNLPHEEVVNMHKTNPPENASVTIFRGTVDKKTRKPKIVLEAYNIIPWKGKM